MEDSRELRGGERAGGSPISTAVTGSLVAALEYGHRHILVWRVRLHVLIHLRVMQRVSPFVPFGDGRRQVRVKEWRSTRPRTAHPPQHRRSIRAASGDRAHQQAASGSAVGHGAPSMANAPSAARAWRPRSPQRNASCSVCALHTRHSPISPPPRMCGTAYSTPRSNMLRRGPRTPDRRKSGPAPYPVMNIGESCAGQSRCQTRETGMRSPSRAVIHTRRSM